MAQHLGTYGTHAHGLFWDRSQRCEKNQCYMRHHKAFGATPRLAQGITGNLHFLSYGSFQCSAEGSNASSHGQARRGAGAEKNIVYVRTQFFAFNRSCHYADDVGPGPTPIWKPYENRTKTVRKPYESRTKTVRKPYENRTETVRKPYGNRTETVRKPYESVGQQCKQPRPGSEGGGSGEKNCVHTRAIFLPSVDPAIMLMMLAQDPPPYGNSTKTVRKPYGNRTKPYGNRTEAVRKPYGSRTEAVRKLYESRTEAVRKPYGNRTKTYGADLAKRGRPYENRTKMV